MDPDKTAPIEALFFWVHTVCFYTKFVSNARELFAADDFSRRHFQMHFFLGALRVKYYSITLQMVTMPGKPNYLYIQARVFKISQNDKLLSENDETTVK